MTKTINTDQQLSFDAVGLWHKAHALFGREFKGEDLLTVHPDPNAWGPFNIEHDIESPLQELLAVGYIQSNDDGATYVLYFSMAEDERGCWECLGYVRPGKYCAGCGLQNMEGDDGEEACQYPN